MKVYSHLVVGVLGGTTLISPLLFQPQQLFTTPECQEIVTKSQSINQITSDEHNKNKQKKLKLVQVVFRHGARTPLTTRYWKGHEWDVCGNLVEYSPIVLRGIDGGEQPESKDNTRQVKQVFPGGCHKGELTFVGQRQALQLGLWLRERYVENLKFLPYQYQANSIVGRTTNYQRTKATLKGVITGMYPNINKTQVTGFVAQDVDEILFANTHKCERLKTLLDHSYAQLKKKNNNNTNENLPTIQKQANIFARGSNHPQEEALMEQVRKIVGEGFELSESEDISFVGFYDAITTLKFHSKELPSKFVELCNQHFKGGVGEVRQLVEKWATQKLLVALSPGQSEEHHKDIMRLSMGLLLQKMVEKMETVAAQADGKKVDLSQQISVSLYLYSGHDTTVTPLLMALGHDVVSWPPYVSNIIFELWEDDGQHYVTALYEGQVMTTKNGDEPRRIDMIPLQEFKRDVIGAYVLTEEEHESECAIVFRHDESLPQPVSAQLPPKHKSGSAISE